MIDIGVGLRTLKKHCKDYGIQLQSVKHLLITHDHADHIKSVGAFSGEYQVPVYATKAVHAGIDNNYCIQRKVADDLKMFVEIGRPFTVGDFHVRPFAVPHDASENVGYEIKVEGITLVIITDVGCVTDEIKDTISRANYLIIEANHDVEMVESGPYPPYLKKRILSANGHLSNAECGKAIAENMSERLRHVWLCHLSEENNHPELARKTVETILRSYGILPGKDVELEVLRRQVPTGVYELISEE
jgi:phosphoribosyl 1,2-cyclic phosphodiesterase